GSSPSVLGEDFASAFRGCLDGGAPVPFPEVRAAVEVALGRPLEQAFASFEPAPLAAASIAVVHRATLLDGTPVAVKVLRPGIEELVAADLDLLRPVLYAIARYGAVELAQLMLGVLDGLREQLAEELDLDNERRAL